MSLQKYINKNILSDTYNAWVEDRTLRIGAGLAYYGVFAIVPASILMLSLAGSFFSTQQIEKFTNTALQEMFGSELSNTIQNIQLSSMDRINEVSFSNLGIIGVVGLIVSVSFMFVAFQDALDTIWRSPKQKGIKSYVKRYFLAYGAVLLFSTLIFSALIIQTVSSLSQYLIPSSLPTMKALADLLFSGVSILAGSLLLSMILKLLLRVGISWRTIIVGSTLTILLMVFGTAALSFYLSNVASASFSGALGGAILVLVWIYYEAQMLLVGMQYMKILALKHGEIQKKDLRLYK